MLSDKDNELLCRVGPGTPMGNLMRQYWMPAVRSDELPTPGLRRRCASSSWARSSSPSATTSGAVGLMQNACPHRGASMFFGRNEEEGLRCVYHGWKFDVTGACVDMPSEPAESNFKNKVHAKAYPTRERGGIIWAYMGPREVPPPLPDLEANMLDEGAAPRSACCTGRATGCRAGKARWTPSTPPSCTAAPNDAEDTKPGTFDYYQCQPARRQVQRRRDRLRHCRTAPTARPKTTRTTGASATCCSRSTP